MNFINIKLEPRLPLVVPRHYRVYIVERGPKRPYFALNRRFLPDIAWVGYIDPYNEHYKYQVRP